MTTRRLFVAALLLLLAPLLHGRGASSTPRNVLEGDGVLYFTHYEGGLWRTDGTAGGTRPVETGGVGKPVLMNGRVYALAQRQNVTRLLAFHDTHAATEIRSFEKMSVSGLTAAGSKLFFFTRETGMPSCVRLWTSDGTAAGTRIVAALFTDDASPLAATPERLLFQLYRGPYEYGYRTNYDTWSSDGTEEGTAALLPRVEWFQRAADLLWFTHEDQLWRTDGTAAGTYPLMRDATLLTDAGTTYIIPLNARPRQLFTTDGTREGTTVVRTFDDAVWTYELRAVIDGRYLFFHDAYGTPAIELRVAAGDGPVEHVRSFMRRPQRFSPSYEQPRMLRAGNLLFFLIPTPQSNDLWRTDGTAEGTVLAKSFPLSRDASLPQLHRIGNNVLLWADDPVYGAEPWISDGTPEGTRMIANLATEGTIRGRVTDAANGRAIAGATIEVHHLSWTGNVILEGTTETDENGEYVFDGVYGADLLVRVRPRREYVAQLYGAPSCTRCKLTDGTHVNVPRDSVVEVDFAVERGARFAGRVIDENGAPLAGVTINVAAAIDAPVFATAISEADGRYVTPAVPAGHSWIVFTSNHPGRSAVVFDGASCAAGCDAAGPSTPVSAAAGEVRHAVDFKLLPFGKLRLHFVDTLTGERFSATVTVRVWPVKPDPRGWATVQAYCNANEECVVTLPDGRYRIDAYASGPRDHVPVWYPDGECAGDWCDDRNPRGEIVAPVAGQTTDLEFRMRPRAARIAGRVTEAGSGRPIASVPIEVIDAKSEVVSMVFTRRDGSYESSANLRPGVAYFVRTRPTETHVAKVYDGGNGILCRWDCVPSPRAVAITVDGTEVRRGVDFRLERTSSVGLSVRDAVTGAPIDQAYAPLTDAAGAEVWFPVQRTTPGMRMIVGIYPGTYTLAPRASGWATPEPYTFTVTYGDTLTRSWVLEPTCRANPSPSGVVVPAAGGTYRMTVGGDCGIVAGPASAPWAHVTSGIMYTYVVERNTGPERVHQFVFPAAVFTIRQEAGN